MTTADHSPAHSLTLRILLGAFLAVLAVLLLSAAQVDPSMRALPILAFVAVVGGAATVPTMALTSRLHRSGWALFVARTVGVLLFGVVVALAFVVARHGPF